MEIILKLPIVSRRLILFRNHKSVFWHGFYSFRLCEVGISYRMYVIGQFSILCCFKIHLYFYKSNVIVVKNVELFVCSHG